MMNFILRIITVFSFLSLLTLSPAWAMQTSESDGRLSRTIHKLRKSRLPSPPKSSSEKKHYAKEEKAEASPRVHFVGEQKLHERDSESTSSTEDSEVDALKKEVLLLREKLAAYVARGFCYKIESMGLLVGTRQTSLEREEFLNALPESFYQGLYRLIRLAYEEKQSLEVIETTQKHELLQSQSVKSHESMRPLLEDKKHVIEQCMNEISKSKSVAKILFPPLYKTLMDQFGQSDEKVWPLILNLLGMQALVPNLAADEGGMLRGRYVADNEKEHAVYAVLKKEMMKMFALTEGGLLKHEGFWLGQISREKQSPIAGNIYFHLMHFLQGCTRSTKE